ncbi:MAG: hypothetical protein ABL933_00285 [Methyloglobulus sp.]|nr:hypothetical protein [Methyloglobulus sp.]
MDAVICRRDTDIPSSKPVKTEERSEKAAEGRLFFEYFLLATQKKVFRLRVRKPD